MAASEEDSSVLRQLIDQIDGELSTFNPVAGNGSEQSLASWTTSQGSLLSMEDGGNGLLASHHTQHRLLTSATSAIFGRSYDRSGHVVSSDAIVPDTNGSYAAGPRAPQYIPSPFSSPISSPISPGVLKKNILLSDQGAAKDERIRLSATPAVSKQLSVGAAAIDLPHEHGITSSQDRAHEGHIQGGDIQEDVEMDIAQTEVPYNDNIKVDVTDLFESFGGALKKDQTTNSASTADREDIHPDEFKAKLMEPTVDLGIKHAIGQPAPRFLELSFSSNDLTSLWTSGSSKSTEKVSGGTEMRTRSHTFHGLSEFDQGNNSGSIQSDATDRPTQNAPLLERSSSLEARYLSSTEDMDPTKDTVAQILSTDNDNGVFCNGQEVQLEMQPGKPIEEQTRFKEQMGASDPRKRLSLVTSGSGLAAAAEAAAASRAQSDTQKHKSYLDLPSWELAPLSPPIEVREISSVQSVVPSPITFRKEFSDAQRQQQEQVYSVVDHSSLNMHMPSPGSAGLMTPTTPLTTREARILAGREALLRMSPDKSRVQRGISASSMTSSITSSASEGAKYNNREGGDSVGAEDASLCISESNSSGIARGGVFGAILQRGESPFKEGQVSAEKLAFPDQSLRPIPLKAYRVRKLTLKERNQVYTEAVQEFTRAKVGLDVWALRSMMQERPALMTDPPTIVKAVAGKYGPGQAPTLNQHQPETFSKGYNDGTGRLTPIGLQFGTSASGVHGGIGARIKNAGKRFSMDISSSAMDGFSTPEPYSHHQHPAHAPHHPPSTSGSLFYKQKSTKSAAELESWSSSRSRAISDSKTPTAQASSSSPSSSTRSGSLPPVTSPGSAPLKRVGSGTGNPGHLFSSSLRAYTKSDMPSALPSFSSRSNSGSSVRAAKRSSLLSEDAANVGGVPVYYDSTGGIRPVNSGPSAGSGFLERPIRKSLTRGSSSRRPMSMMIIPNREESEAVNTGDSFAPLESRPSLGSISSESNLPELQRHDHEGQLQRQGGSETSLADASTRLVHSANGLPFADETSSKDEVYSPLTSPIMIPVSGFRQQSHNQWSSPQLGFGHGQARPLTYAGTSSSSTISTSASIIMSPVQLSASGIPSPPPRESSQPQSVYSLSSPTAESGLVMGAPIRSETDQRHSTSSFSSLASFAKYQKRDAFSTGTSPKRLSKKDKKKEEVFQQKQQQQQQRYSVSSAAVVDNQISFGGSSKNDYVTEQSLDRLGDVLPHVDRDRLSIYLQRSYGDEMVAIGLAMADLRNGQI